MLSLPETDGTIKYRMDRNDLEPTTGCDKISAGCKFCYAEVMTRRLKAMGVEKYKDGFEVRIHEDELNTPYSWKKPKVIFVNSMSDAIV